MGWNPFTLFKGKPAGATQAAPKKAEAPDTKAAEAGLQDLEQKGMLSKFFRHWKNPAFLKQLKVLVARMQADGVNVRDKNAVQAWIKKHEAEIESGKFAEEHPVEKPQPFVKTGPEVGRNDPCTCGSGKKYKKCCGAAA